MQTAGLLIIIIALILWAYWVIRNNNHKKWAVGAASAAIFAGFFLVVSDRQTEVSIKGIGTIKAAAAAAEVDAEAVSEIRKRVENQSANIDLVAADAKEIREITDEIRSKGSEVEEKVEEIDRALEKAISQTDELSEILVFTNTVVAAQTDDRIAYDRLKQWSMRNDYRFQKESQSAYTKIMDEHSQGWYSSNPSISWNGGIDPSKINLYGLEIYYSVAPVTLRPALLEYIWLREDIPKMDRMDFLIKVIEKDSSLNAVEYAGRYFTRGAKLKIKPLAIDYLIQWWSDNREGIENNLQQSE